MLKMVYECVCVVFVMFMNLYEVNKIALNALPTSANYIVIIKLFHIMVNKCGECISIPPTITTLISDDGCMMEGLEFTYCANCTTANNYIQTPIVLIKIFKLLLNV